MVTGLLGRTARGAKKIESWRVTLLQCYRRWGTHQNQGQLLIFKIYNKIFPKLICQKLKTTRDNHQNIDQTGFKLGTGIENVFFIFASLWNLYQNQTVFQSERCEIRTCHKLYFFQCCFGVGSTGKAVQTAGDSWLGNCRKSMEIKIPTSGMPMI